MKTKKDNLRVGILFTLILSAAFCINNAFGAVIRVPDDQPTIQEAIDIANYLDTVLVAPDIYGGPNNVNIDFKMKAITVKCDGSPGSCVIDCENTAWTRGFIFQRGEGNDSKLSGFTIKNGDQKYGGGIYITNSSPVISACIIEYNHASWDGGGIYCTNSSPKINNCKIRWNTANHYGGGVFSIGSGPILNNCVISYNTADYGAGSCSYGGGTNPEIINSTISMNSAGAAGGGGIACLSSSSQTVTNSILWNDSPDEIYGCTSPVTYSDVRGGFPGEGNIDEDPVFLEGYHLDCGQSPVIDQGSNAAVISSEDFDGEDRICNGTVDMGADECCKSPPPETAISPSTGYYAATQEFDLTLLVGPSDCSGLGISATLNGTDVTAALNDCLIPGTLSVGGQSFRCPGVGQMLDPDYYTFSVTFDFDDCKSATKTVKWYILSNTEP